MFKISPLVITALILSLNASAGPYDRDMDAKEVSIELSAHPIDTDMVANPDGIEVTYFEVRACFNDLLTGQSKSEFNVAVEIIRDDSLGVAQVKTDTKLSVTTNERGCVVIDDIIKFNPVQLKKSDKTSYLRQGIHFVKYNFTDKDTFSQARYLMINPMSKNAFAFDTNTINPNLFIRSIMKSRK